MLCFISTMECWYRLHVMKTIIGIAKIFCPFVVRRSEQIDRASQLLKEFEKAQIEKAQMKP